MTAIKLPVRVDSVEIYDADGKFIPPGAIVAALNGPKDDLRVLLSEENDRLIDQLSAMRKALVEARAIGDDRQSQSPSQAVNKMQAVIDAALASPTKEYT